MKITLEPTLSEVPRVNQIQNKVKKDKGIKESVQKIATEIDLLRNLKLLQEIRSDLVQWVKEHSLSSAASEELFKPLLPDVENLFMESAHR